MDSCKKVTAPNFCPSRIGAAAVNPPIANLFQGQDIVDEIITLKDKQTTLNRLFRFPNRIRHFDTAILFQNHLEAALVPWLAGIPERIGYSLHGRHFLLTNRAYPRIKERHRHRYEVDIRYQDQLESKGDLIFSIILKQFMVKKHTFSSGKIYCALLKTKCNKQRGRGQGLGGCKTFNRNARRLQQRPGCIH